MIKKLLGGSLLLVLSLVVLGTVGNHKALAFYTNYCDVLASPSSPNSTTAANCQNGQNNNGLTGLNTSSQSALKSSFISKIENYRSSGYGFQKVGAAYIEAGLQARGGSWVNNINNPAVTLSIGTIPNTYACTNTAYYAPGNYVTGTGDCAYGASALLIYEGGVLVYIIKIDCGNPMGNLGGPSPYNPNTPPSGSISVSCNNNGTGTATARFSDPNGSSSRTYAFIRVYAGPNWQSSTAYGTSASWGVPEANASSGTWTAYLYVDDIGGSGYQYKGAATIHSCYWSASATASVSPSPVYPSQSTTFIYNVRNSGPNSATFAYNDKVEYRNGATAVSVPSATWPGGSTTYGDTNVWPQPNATATLGSGGSTSSYDSEGIRIPNNISGADRICGWRSFDPTNSAGGRYGNSNTACAAISYPAPSCTLNVPSSVTVGESFTVSPQTTYQDSTAASVVWGTGGRAFYSISGGPSASGGSLSGRVISGSWTVSGLSTGTYTITGGVQGSSVPSGNISTCSRTVNVVYTPYFNVMGGDVAAGPGFGSACTDNNSAGIIGTNTDGSGSGPFYGAGTQLAALALGSIQSFATSQNADGSDAGAGIGKGLAFANTTGGGTTYGGRYGKAAWCVPDYAANATIHATATASPGVINVGTLPDGVTYVTGDVTISGTLPAGRRATLVVKNGDVFIDGNITYAAYADTSHIPQFRLLVTGGDIYIKNQLNPGATDELHGFYEAQPAGGTGGNIYTCATAIRAPVTGANQATDYGTCNQQLVIYGSLAAKSIAFERTYGNLTAAGGATNGPAEKIVYTPELWLGDLSGPNNSCQSDDGGVSGCTFQAFTGLPPVL